MRAKENKLFNAIPKKYRSHIDRIKIEKSGCYNDRGQELNDYTLFYDNGTEVTFQSINQMLFMLREYSIDGYYVSP